MSSVVPIIRRTVASADEMESLGMSLGACLSDGVMVALIGDLGAGKTTLTRGIVDGVARGEGDFVASPTYNVCHRYPTDPPVHHYDLYRISDEDDLESVGFYDSVGAGIVLIEWPERVASVVAMVDLIVRITPVDAHTRTVDLEVKTDAGGRCVAAWYAFYASDDADDTAHR